MGYFDNRMNNQIHAQQWRRYTLEKYSKEIEYSIKNSKVYDFCNGGKPIADIISSINGEDLYIKYEGNQLDPENSLNRYGHTFIDFIKGTTVDALYEMPKYGNNGKVAVLNFASFKNPGGKFMDGSSAQEESLCHASTLYEVLYNNPEFYNTNHKMLNQGLYTHRVLYTPDIIFEKENKIISADVITCAFPNLGAFNRRGIKLDPEYYHRVISHRIMAILDSALINQVDTVILGAIGCGVFKNPPSAVALAFDQVIEKYYLGTFKRLIFAIPDQRTYDTFYQLLYGEIL